MTLSGLHPYPVMGAPSSWTSEAFCLRGLRWFRSSFRSALRCFEQLLWPLLTSRSAARPTWPFQTQGEISPDKNNPLPRTTAGFTPPELWSRELRDHWLARPARHRLLSSFCSSARGFAPRFLQTLGRPHALAARFDRCDLLSGGLPPPRCCPCWAYQRRRGGPVMQSRPARSRKKGSYSLSRIA